MEMTLIDINQAALATGFEVKTIRNWVSKRLLPYYKIDGIRFKKEELVAFVESRRVEPIGESELSQKADDILNRNANERKTRGFHK